MSDSAASLRWFFKVDFDQVEEILFFEDASQALKDQGMIYEMQQELRKA